MNNPTEKPSYKEGLQELRVNLENMLPKEALKVFDDDAEKLEKAYAPIPQLINGDIAPDFSLSNAKGETVKLSNLLKTNRVVLTFYRGTWCPYCNLQLNQYQQILPEIKSLGVQLVAISPQTPDESLNIKEKNELQFEVLSDNGNMVAKKYTTVFKNDDAPINVMTDLGFDYESHYSDDSRELPVPAVFIIEQNGIVSFSKTVGGDYRNRVESIDIMNALKK